MSTILPQGAEIPYNKKVHNREHMTTATITENILKHTQELCNALKQNYISDCVRYHERELVVEPNSKYHTERLDELKSGVCDYDFV